MPLPLIPIIVAVVRLAAPVVINIVVKQVIKQAPKVAKEVAKQAPKAAKEAVKAAPKKAASGPKKGNTPLNKYKDKAKNKKKKDPCEDYKKNRKKRKYVVYKADEYDKAGNKIGTYVGRTSGAPGESTKTILKRRQTGHHRNVKNIQPLFETDSYPAVRGAEEIYQKKIGTSEQINPVSPKNKRKDDYDKCASSKGAK